MITINRISRWEPIPSSDAWVSEVRVHVPIVDVFCSVIDFPLTREVKDLIALKLLVSQFNYARNTVDCAIGYTRMGWKWSWIIQESDIILKTVAKTEATWWIVIAIPYVTPVVNCHEIYTCPCGFPGGWLVAKHVFDRTVIAVFAQETTLLFRVCHRIGLVIMDPTETSHMNKEVVLIEHLEVLLKPLEKGRPHRVYHRHFDTCISTLQ